MALMAKIGCAGSSCLTKDMGGTRILGDGCLTRSKGQHNQRGREGERGGRGEGEGGKEGTDGIGVMVRDITTILSFFLIFAVPLLSK